MRGDSNGLSHLSGPTYSPAEWFPVHLIKSADTLRHHTLSCQRKWLYTGLGRKLEAREKMKRPSVNGIPNVPNLLVSFFVAQKEMANSKWHTLMNDTHFFLNQKYFRNVKKEQILLILLNGKNIFLLKIFSVPVLLFSCVWTKYSLPFSSPIFFSAIYLSASVRVLHCWIRAVDWLRFLMVLLNYLIHGVCNECRK